MLISFQHIMEEAEEIINSNLDAEDTSTEESIYITEGSLNLMKNNQFMKRLSDNNVELFNGGQKKINIMLR